MRTDIASVFVSSLILSTVFCVTGSVNAAPQKETKQEVAKDTLTAPTGFVSICTLDENCAVENSSLVAFGAEDQFVYKTLKGEFLCAPSTFNLSRNWQGSAPTCSVLDLESSEGIQSSSLAAGSDGAPGFRVADGSYALISRSSGKALSIKSASQDDGAAVTQQNFRQAEHQIWRIQYHESGYYSITAEHSEKSLESNDWNSKDGSHLQQLPWINSWGQHWDIQPADDGFVKVLSRANGQSLDAYEMSLRSKNDVVLWTYWGGENQQWKLVPIPSAAE